MLRFPNSQVSRFCYALFSYQREQVHLARSHSFDGLVMEGRDIGTVIFPEADLKIFLHADPLVRENRRRMDGETDQISFRDKQDRQRQVAPLKEVPDLFKSTPVRLPSKKCMNVLSSISTI